MTQTQQRPQPIFDKQDQLSKIMANLLQGEVVIAVYDCIGGGTGFVGITDRRVIIQDNSFVGKKVALTSIPYSKINAVSFVSTRACGGTGRPAHRSASAPVAGSTSPTSAASPRPSTPTTSFYGT
jgi:hypothetical protein